MDNYFLNVVQYQNDGIPIGIYSICFSSRYVLETLMLQAKQDESFFLMNLR
jgi:tagatose-1,6-bisphosphate aldolase non-catalytic subunit AgaZ/GatZ